MRYANQLIISAAGGGKTTRVVDKAVRNVSGTTALITYTRNNVREITSKVYERCPVVPSNVEVMSWYVFLLRELARPYRAAMHPHRIDRIFWVDGRSVQYIPEHNTSAHYFWEGSQIYSDKIAKFVCALNKKTNGAVMNRLKQRFAHIVIDEIQDMAGYDLDLLELILKTGIEVTLVGDHRQATFTTNNSQKNKVFRGPDVINKFRAWEKAGIVEIVYETHTYRCNQPIADLGDIFFPDEPKTNSLNQRMSGHDGIFLVAPSEVSEYIQRFAPQVLRYSAATKCEPYVALNFGESKGMTFDRVLIFPHGKAISWLSSGSLGHVAKSKSKMYVAVTRARYSVAFVYDGACCEIESSRWTP